MDCGGIKIPTRSEQSHRSLTSEVHTGIVVHPTLRRVNTVSCKDQVISDRSCRGVHSKRQEDEFLRIQLPSINGDSVLSLLGRDSPNGIGLQIAVGVSWLPPSSTEFIGEVAAGRSRAARCLPAIGSAARKRSRRLLLWAHLPARTGQTGSRQADPGELMGSNGINTRLRRDRNPQIPSREPERTMEARPCEGSRRVALLTCTSRA